MLEKVQKNSTFDLCLLLVFVLTTDCLCVMIVDVRRILIW